MQFWCKGVLTVALCLLSGCQSLHYYGQTIKGQWQIVSQRQPIERLLQRPDTDPQLARQLATIQKIRRFAEGLGLPVKGQFDTYVDIHRPYAMWSVSATPELSLQAKTWCYLVVGCLSYRSYFDLPQAEQAEIQLQDQGYDTYLSRVAAYSTLGWFRDSVLSSYISKSEAELAELLFHELAHQVAYAKNDPVFNESFAEVVAEEGLKRYLAGQTDYFERMAVRKKRQQQFAELVLEYRRQLGALYASATLTAVEKRQHKQQIFTALRQSYQQLKAEQWQGYNGYDAWFEQLSNAKLNSIAIYNELIPQLNAVLVADNLDLPAFYRQCRKLATLSRQERRRILDSSQSLDQ